MSHWTLLQVVFNLFVFAVLGALAWRIRRPPQDDPRLSRGLQLLQTKITVLEDLSDRTEAQVKQLTALIDQKTRALQNKVIEAEQQILKMDHSVGRAAAAGPAAAPAVPQAELIERHRTVEYVRAAKMANAGLSVEQISQKVQLPREQLELIAKFNRERLMFDENQLPEWATAEPSAMGRLDFVGETDKPRPDVQRLARIESDFKQAVAQVRRADEAAHQSIMETKMAETIRASIQTGMDTVQPAVIAVKATAQTLREKLVTTAEDILRAQSAAPAPQAPPAAEPVSAAEPQVIRTVKTTAFNIGNSNSTGSDRATVKKVIFPRIEKPPVG